MKLEEMSVAELKKTVFTLETKKTKNEENVPANLLSTKYAKAFFLKQNEKIMVNG